MKIYIDLVLILNFLIDLVLLLSVALILRRQTNLRRLLLASITGSISIFSLLFDFNNFILILIKFIIAIIMVLLAFSYHDFKYTIRNVFYLYTSSIVLGGFLYMIDNSLCYQNEGLIFYHNGLSLNLIMLLILSPLIIYTYIKQTLNLKENYAKYYNIDIYLKNSEILSLTAFLDTGNKLFDPYFKRPIILVNKNKIDFNYIDDNVLLVPYNTLNNHGILKCIIPDKIYIDKVGIRNNFLIGISEDEIKIDGVDCILNEKILEGKVI